MENSKTYEYTFYPNCFALYEFYTIQNMYIYRSSIFYTLIVSVPINFRVGYDWDAEFISSDEWLIHEILK